MPLSQEGLVKAKELIARYPKPRSAMLPLLFLLQAEEGYVSPAGIAQVADLLGVTRAEVGAVATFYTMFHRRPAGKYVVSVCRTLSCQMRGSDEVTDALLKRCGIELGGTTPDGRVTVEEVECLAACDGAPVVQVNYENYERMTPEQAEALADALLRDEVPPPTFAERGSVTPSSSAAAYWRLADPMSEPPAHLAGDAAATAEARADGTVEAAAQSDGEAAQTAGSGTARRRRRGRGPAEGEAPSVEDAATDTEAQAPQPTADDQDAAQPEASAGARPRRRQSRRVADEAGPHDREQPGGDPQ